MNKGAVMSSINRREVLKLAGAAGVAATGPWWRVGKSQAQRAKRLVYWHLPNFTPLADQIQKEQVYEFAKQAGLKESEVEYAVVANEQAAAKLAASIESGNPPDVIRLYESNVQFYGSQGHLIDVTDLLTKMRREPKGIFESSMTAVMYKGRALGVPLAVNPWPVHARLDLLEQAKVEYPKTWDEFIETSKKIQAPPRLFAFGMCLGLVEDTTDIVMNPSSIYAYLDSNDKDLQKVTGLFPVPAGPKGTVNQIDTWSYGAFKKNPYPDLARGLIEYFMQPANYDKIIQSTGGRWVPVYKRLFDSPFWREKPEFKHFINMAETGVPVSYAGSPTPAAGEVLNTHLIPKMVQRVLVDNWEAARALDECHKRIVEVYARYARG